VSLSTPIFPDIESVKIHCREIRSQNYLSKAKKREKKNNQMTARAMIAGGFHLVKPSIGESMFDEAEPKALQSRIKVMAKQLISLGRKKFSFLLFIKQLLSPKWNHREPSREKHKTTTTSGDKTKIVNWIVEPESRKLSPAIGITISLERRLFFAVR
jgi:hypothetical protein